MAVTGRRRTQRHLFAVPDSSSGGSVALVGAAFAALEAAPFLQRPAELLAPLRGTPDRFWAEYDRLFALPDGPSPAPLLEGLREFFRGQRVAFRAERAAAELQVSFPADRGGIDDSLVGLVLHLSTITREPEALGFALALTVVGRPDVRVAAAVAVARLRAAGGSDPSWAAAVGRPTFDRAFHANSATGEMTNLVLQFRYGHRHHAVVLLIDRTEWARGGAKDAWTSELSHHDELVRRFSELEVVAPLTEAEAAAMVDAVLAVPARPGTAEQAESVPPALQLLAARRRTMQPVAAAEAPPMRSLDGDHRTVGPPDSLDRLLGNNRLPLVLIEIIATLGSNPVGLSLLQQATDVTATDPEPTGPTEWAALSAFQWFLDQAADGGLDLTQAGYLKPAFVEQAATVLPSLQDWQGTTREVDAAPLFHLRTWLQSAGLLRKYKGRLLLTKRGKKAQQDPASLWDLLAELLVPQDDPAKFDDHATALILLKAAQQSGRLALPEIANLMTEIGWRVGTAQVTEYHLFPLPIFLVLANLTDQDPGRHDRRNITPTGAALARATLALGADEPDEDDLDPDVLHSLVEQGLLGPFGEGGPAPFGSGFPFGGGFPPHFSEPTLLPRNSAHLRYVVRVDLDEATPPVWRRLALSSRLTLDQVHRVLQVAMGWEDYHLHEFTMGPDTKDRSVASFRTDQTDLDDDMSAAVHESAVRLDQVLATPGQRLFYQYDFGDSWEHTLKLEKVEPWTAGDLPARCLTGRRAGPPEDCGGIGGFTEIVEALDGGPLPEVFDSAKHFRDWLPAGYDPAAFDQQTINSRLHILLADH